MPKLSIIADRPTDAMYAAGGEIECQCARCGSSCSIECCEECDDGYYEYDYGDDCCEELLYRTCLECNGTGTWHQCLSSPEYCQANPLPGREGVGRGRIEWYATGEAK